MGIQERREREKEERRNQIIKTARKEFIESGIRNSSIKDIARKAELSPRTIYTYFNNKQELYVAVLLSGLKILCKQIEKIASEEQKAFEKKFIDVTLSALHQQTSGFADKFKKSEEH